MIACPMNWSDGWCARVDTAPAGAATTQSATTRLASKARSRFDTRNPPCELTDRRSLARERPEVGVRDGAVADALVDAVRGRVGEVGVEEAEPPPGVEQALRQRRGERARVAAAAQLGRGV